MPGMWATGIVAIHNANDSGDGLALRTYQELRRATSSACACCSTFPVCNLDHLRRASGCGAGWAMPGCASAGSRFFADGVLGSRTASMLQPYVDEPNNWGVAAMDPEEMLEQALAASAAGLSLTIHAIGDRANRDVLNVLAEVRRQEASGERANSELHGNVHRSSIRHRCRHRIEHVQCIHPDDLPRLAQLDVIASVQPIHATSDMRMVDRVLGAGARAGRLCVSQPAGQRRPAGLRLRRSDRAACAADRHPRRGHPAPRAMARLDADGWQGQERITVAEAVDAYTYWPAYAAGEEGYRGSIAPGKVADLVVLSQDIFAVDPMAILETQVDMTVLDGEVVWTG